MKKRKKSKTKSKSKNTHLNIRLDIEDLSHEQAQFNEELLRELYHVGINDFSAPNIFLCYSHRDIEFVQGLSEQLDALGVFVWVAEWQLEVGDSLHRCIGEGIEKSDFVGIVLSPDSLSSAWCRDELDQALMREKRDGSKIVLPLLCRPVKLPPFLEGRLYLDFSDSYLSSLARLAGTLYRIPPRYVCAELIGEKLESVKDVKAIVDQLLPLSNRVRVLPQETYSAVRHLLAESGIDIDTKRFGLVTGQPLIQIVCLDTYFVNNPISQELSKKRLDGQNKSEQQDTSVGDDDAADP